MLWVCVHKDIYMYLYVFLIKSETPPPSPEDTVGTSWNARGSHPRTSSRPGGWGPAPETPSFSGFLNATRWPAASFQAADGARLDTVVKADWLSSWCSQSSTTQLSFYFPSYLQDLVKNGICRVFLDRRLHLDTLLRQHAQLDVPAELWEWIREGGVELREDSVLHLLTGDTSSSLSLWRRGSCRRPRWSPGRSCCCCRSGWAPARRTHWRPHGSQTQCWCCCCCPEEMIRFRKLLILCSKMKN